MRDAGDHLYWVGKALDYIKEKVNGTLPMQDPTRSGR